MLTLLITQVTDPSSRQPWRGRPPVGASNDFAWPASQRRAWVASKKTVATEQAVGDTGRPVTTAGFYAVCPAVIPLPVDRAVNLANQRSLQPAHIMLFVIERLRRESPCCNRATAQ